jgi:hypothetical protein
MYMYSIIVSKLLCLVYEEGVLTNSARYYNKNQTEKRERERKKGDNRGGDGSRLYFLATRRVTRQEALLKKTSKPRYFRSIVTPFFFFFFFSSCAARVYLCVLFFPFLVWPSSSKYISRINYRLTFCLDFSHSPCCCVFLLSLSFSCSTCDVEPMCI